MQAHVFTKKNWDGVTGKTWDEFGVEKGDPSRGGEEQDPPDRDERVCQQLHTVRPTARGGLRRRDTSVLTTYWSESA